VTAAVDVRDLFRVHRTAEGDSAPLQGISLLVEEGEVVTVLGPSGSGKSTLLRCLAALEPPSAGVVLVAGLDVGRLSPTRAAAYRARLLGMVDQHYGRALSPDLRCREIVELQPSLLGIPPAKRRTRSDELLERVRLRDAADALPSELSGGEQQRVAVCAALAHRPRLLLADEPSGELDAASAEAVYALIGELAREEGTTVVLVSHDPGSAAIADRALLVRDGRVSEERLPGRPAAAVIGHGGWVHLPAELLEPRFGDRAELTASTEGIVVRPAGGSTTAPRPMPDGNGDGRSGTAVSELRDVTKRYGTDRRVRTVVTGLNARFEGGALSAITGRSGSGKSTLLALLAGLERPSAGDVVLLGEPLSALPRAALAERRRRSVAVVSQQPGLIEFLSAAENVSLALVARGAADGGADRRAREELVRLGLAHRLDQRVDRLSAGERQRVAIARALAADAPLVLVDEPTSRLDQANAETVADILAAAARRTGAAVVCATHDPLLVERAGATLAL
jgi:ABC-type lipoprotein export system ATPase subunit